MKKLLYVRELSTDWVQVGVPIIIMQVTLALKCDVFWKVYLLCGTSEVGDGSF